MKHRHKQILRAVQMRQCGTALIADDALCKIRIPSQASQRRRTGGGAPQGPRGTARSRQRPVRRRRRVDENARRGARVTAARRDGPGA